MGGKCDATKSGARTSGSREEQTPRDPGDGEMCQGCGVVRSIIFERGLLSSRSGFFLLFLLSFSVLINRPW